MFLSKQTEKRKMCIERQAGEMMQCDGTHPHKVGLLYYAVLCCAVWYLRVGIVMLIIST